MYVQNINIFIEFFIQNPKEIYKVYKVYKNIKIYSLNYKQM